MKHLLCLLALLPLAVHAGALEHFNAGDFELAALEARNELEQNPEQLETLLVLGRSQLAANRIGDAVETLRRATALQPRSHEAHYRLGQALTLQLAEVGAWRKVLVTDDIGVAFEHAVALEPKNSEYRYALFEFYRHAPSFLGGGRRKAEQQATALVKIDAARGHRAVAELLAQDGHPAEAEKEMRAAIATQPDVADHRFALGYYHQQQKRWAAAFATFEEIRQRFPNEPQALFQIGKTASLSGERVDDGIGALQRYLQHKPKADEPPLSWAHYRLGLLFERQQKVDEARKQYRAAMELDPKLAEAKQALRALDGS